MGIRKATPSDHRAMAEVAARAFTNSSLFGTFMYPHRLDHPQDYISMWEWSIWTNFQDPAHVYLVSVDEKTGNVVAWAGWERRGTTPPASLIQRLRHISATKWNDFNAWLFANKAADPAHVAAFHAAKPLSKHLWEGDRAENWYLDFLCTDPASEGKGHGKGLVNWGIERADEEGVRASLISGHRKEAFYAKFGFVEVGKAHVGPLAGVEGGTIMFRDVK